MCISTKFSSAVNAYGLGCCRASAETKAACSVRLTVTTDLLGCQKPPGESRPALGVHCRVDGENMSLLGSLSKRYCLWPQTQDSHWVFYYLFTWQEIDTQSYKTPCYWLKGFANEENSFEVSGGALAWPAKDSSVIAGKSQSPQTNSLLDLSREPVSHSPSEPSHSHMPGIVKTALVPSMARRWP